MTAKKFVLSIYPTAYALSLGKTRDDYGIFDGKVNLLSSGNVEPTVAIAWKNEAENIRKEMLRKFES